MRTQKSAVLATVMVMAAMGAAFAHTKMKSSTPVDGATIPAGLSQIEMTFSRPMRLTLVRVHRAADDTDVALKGPLPKAFTDTAKVALEALDAGAYAVSWTAVSKDGHVMKGHFAFTVSGAPAQ